MAALRTALRYALVPIVLALVVSGLHAQSPGQARVRVIISFAQPPGPSEEALIRGAGGTVHQRYWLVPAVAADVPQVAIQGLQNNPNVVSVTPDTVVVEVDAELDASWGVKHIGSGLVHGTGNKGAGVKVCVIDSGIDYTHPDLDANYLGGWDFVNNDSDPFDDRGHGTHVAGIIAAEDNNSGVVGVAPEADVLAYKILDQNGQGFFSNAIGALQACLEAGGQVTNNSFGAQSDPDGNDPLKPVKTAYDNAEALGLLHVAAAGNRTSFFGTCTTIGYPARYASVIAVTATNSSNSIISSSCRGAEAELAAPGNNVTSTVPTGSCAHCTSSGYAALTGTSMASPHVVGVAALVIASGIGDADGDESINDDVRSRLQQTADDLGVAGRDSSYGYGLVDADEAAPPVAPVPPGAPFALTATVAASSPSSQIDLSWIDNADNESGFKIERCTGNPCVDAWGQITTVGPNVTTHASTGLSASTTYTFRVRAYNGGGDSAYSNEASAITDAQAAPAAPSTLSITDVASSRIDLSWQDHADNESGFKIERCTGHPCTDAFVQIAAVGTNVTTYASTGLSPSTTYTFRVRAYNGGGDSAYSIEAWATTEALASITLSATGYKVQGRQKVDLTWNGASSTSVDIYRNTVKITTANDGFHTDNIDARGGGSYTYRLCEAGTTTCSNEVLVTF